MDITLYRQARADGGVRTGIDGDGATLLERFEPGADDSDPALVWFVDVLFRDVPLEDPAPDAAREFLRRQGPAVTPRLVQIADDELAAGVDLQQPLWRTVPDVNGVKAEVVASGARRLAAR